jgi:hypothetical protein
VQSHARDMELSPPEGRLSERVLRHETLLVLALSLGASGVSALISFIGSVTAPGGLKDKAATLNASEAPGRPSTWAAAPRWRPG